jgi:hypothetical protein
MPVVVQNKRASHGSDVWVIVSKVTAAVLGGYVVTYWTGIAVAKAALGWHLLSRADAGNLAGIFQLTAYVGVIIGVSGMRSMKKAWLVVAVLTALLVAISVIAPGPPLAGGAAAR